MATDPFAGPPATTAVNPQWSATCQDSATKKTCYWVAPGTAYKTATLFLLDVLKALPTAKILVIQQLPPPP